MTKDACWACRIEAEIGTEETPHPVPKRYHLCALLEPREVAPRDAKAHATRYDLQPGPDGEPGDHAREMLRLLAFLGDEDFVAREILALILLWMDERVFTQPDADRVSDFFEHLALRQKAGPGNTPKKRWYACEVCGDNISPDEGVVGKRCPPCAENPKGREMPQ